MKHRCLMIGVGGMAGFWLGHVLKPQMHRLEFAGLVDVSPEALELAARNLDVDQSRCFTDVKTAFASVDADFCLIVTPPQFHRQSVELACAQGMDILSEKPIAASWEDCIAIYKAVKKAGVKMQVTQNYRYGARMVTLKDAVSRLGKVNYALGRYASDYRIPGSWGANFRHTMSHSLLVEGGIHHFDQLRNLTGGDVETICGYEWHPGQIRGALGAFASGESFEGEPCALFNMDFNNGAFGCYEGNNLASGKLNSWHREMYRVECEDGAAVLDSDDVVRIYTRENGSLVTHETPTISPQFDGHAMIPEQFLNWREGDEIPPTNIEDNLKSNATLFASIIASHERRVVNVREMLEAALSN